MKDCNDHGDGRVDHDDDRDDADHPDTGRRAGVYGLKMEQLLERSIVVAPGQHVRISAGYAGQDDEPGLSRLRPRDIDDVKRWIGVPDELAAKRCDRRCGTPSVVGAASSSELRRMSSADRLAVRALAERYVKGDSRSLVAFKPSLNSLLDRAYIPGVFLRKDITIHGGAVLEVAADVKVLFARHIRIYRGGLLKLVGDSKVDAVTIRGGLLKVTYEIQPYLPSFAKLLTQGAQP